MLDLLNSFVQSHGYNFTPSDIDGEFHTFHDSHGNKGWYIGETLPSGKISFFFGDWRKPGEKFSFLNESSLKDEERAEYAKIQEKFKSQKQERQEQAKTAAQDLFSRWERLGNSGESKYLATKNLPQRIPGSVVKPQETGGACLVVPLYDEHGAIWNFQSTFDSGDKLFFPFARTEGLFFEIKAAAPQSRTVLCEGFATGMAINLATGFRVIVAFSLSNLEKIIEKFPEADIAADFDGKTYLDMKKKGAKDPSNPGLREGVRLAQLYRRKLYLPTTDIAAGNIDFADLWAQGGKDLVLPCFAKPIDLESMSKEEPAKSTSNKAYDIIGHWINGLDPMPMKKTKNGKPILPEEMEVAEKLYLYYKGSIIKSGGDLFIWDEKYWRAFTDADRDHIFRQIIVLHGGLGTYPRFQNVLKNFIGVIPEATQNLFYTNPQRITFNNGTLALDFIGGKWSIVFRPDHRKDDFSTNLIPYDYDPAARNSVFEETIHNILGDDEGEAKIRAVKQMFGSALAPMYPRLFLLVGKPGSGKSTLILLASALVSEGNVCSLQPSKFEGFEMELMAGKLINAVTDLNVVKPISDEVIKQIEDRVPLTINRKYKKAIQAPFPAVHLFGANDIPPTLERGSMSHTRRWTFIQCDKFGGDITTHDKHRIDKIRASGMAGVINFAIEGLKDLLEHNGKFFVPESGAKRMSEWQTENDPIASFVEAMRKNEDEIPFVFDPDGRVKPVALWAAFGEWHDASYYTKPRIPKMKFYRKLENHLGVRKTHQGHQFYCGVSQRPTKSTGGKSYSGGNQSGKDFDDQRNDAGFQMYETTTEIF